MNASFAGSMPRSGGISIFSQSGALCTAILDHAAGRGFGLAKLVSIGNKADLSEVELLTALGDDPQTKVIVGVLAGTEIAFGAAFHRSGIIRADVFEQILDFATALSLQPLPRGDRVLIVTNAGGPGTMAADAVEKAGLQVAALGRNTAAALRSHLPQAASTGNPVDVLGDADPARYVAALEAAQDDPGVDAILVLLTPQAMTRPTETARAIAGCLRHDKPVLAVFMGGRDVLPAREELVAAGLPEYPSPERAIAALRAMHEYALWRRRPPRLVTRFRVNRRRVERIISRRVRTGHLQLGEVKAKSILAAYGFRIPGGVLATSSGEAVEAAEHLGYPVVMKVVSPDIVHKSDIGGVRVGITTRREVKDAFDLMSLRIREHAPEAHIEGYYVELMVPRGLEVILGMTRDPLLRAAPGRARAARRRCRRHRRGAAARQPARDRFPRDRRTRHQPAHGGRGWHRADCRRRPHHAARARAPGGTVTETASCVGEWVYPLPPAFGRSPSTRAGVNPAPTDRRTVSTTFSKAYSGCFLVALSGCSPHVPSERRG